MKITKTIYVIMHEGGDPVFSLGPMEEYGYVTLDSFEIEREVEKPDFAPLKRQALEREQVAIMKIAEGKVQDIEKRIQALEGRV